MWPLAIVSSTMRMIGQFTPQAWAVDAWTTLLSSHGDILAIGREPNIRAPFAVGFFTVATLQLRRVLATGSVECGPL